MPRRLNLPDSASVAQPGDNGRLFAPSAARNSQAICDALCQIAPPSGRALELASGTGQHVVSLARAMPALSWQPTEIDAARRTSIDAHAADAALSNVAPAVALDATAPGWGGQHPGQDLIFLSNLLHLVSETEARCVVREAALALAPGGLLAIYGPFMRDDALTSDGDAAFHASLQAQDPEIGYKSDFDVVDWGGAARLEFAGMIEMPANNLLICWHKPSQGHGPQPAAQSQLT